MTDVRSRAFLFRQFFYYWLKAIDKYSLQSPFIYHFYTQVIELNSVSHDFSPIENLRQDLIRDNRTIDVLDLGVGSKVLKGKTRKVSSIARTSLSSSKFSQFLFKIILNRNPHNALELGTSFGINTIYLAKAKPTMPVYTFEGCPSIANIASQNFKKLECENISLIQGNLDQTLSVTLQQLDTIDIVYFDANHTKEATLQYFSLCLEKTNPRSIFIFDDIHQSKEMNEAWKEISTNHKITMSIDIFDAGLIFFEEGLQKKKYILNF